QQRLWFLAQLDPDSVEYIVPVVLPWPGVLDPVVLGRALGALVARHEVLRTRLVSDAGGGPHQVIDPAPAEGAVPVVGGSAEPDRDPAVARLIAAAVGVPFDLAADPLLRALTVRLAADRHIVVLAMHHVVGDEWSAGIIRRELVALYDALTRDAEPRLPELPV